MLITNTRFFIPNKFTRACKEGEREPWLLVSNLPESDWDAERIVNLFNQRMQIEEGFRDTRNERYGLALNYCRRYRLAFTNPSKLVRPPIIRLNNTI